MKDEFNVVFLIEIKNIITKSTEKNYYQDVDGICKRVIKSNIVGYNEHSSKQTKSILR
jgi:hypothetical protein